MGSEAVRSDSDCKQERGTNGGAGGDGAGNGTPGGTPNGAASDTAQWAGVLCHGVPAGAWILTWKTARQHNNAVGFCHCCGLFPAPVVADGIIGPISPERASRRRDNGILIFPVTFRRRTVKLWCGKSPGFDSPAPAAAMHGQ